MSKRYRLGTTSTSYPDAQKVGWSNAVWRNTCKLQLIDSPRGLVPGNFFQIPCLDRVSIPPCQPIAMVTVSQTDFFCKEMRIIDKLDLNHRLPQSAGTGIGAFDRFMYILRY